MDLVDALSRLANSRLARAQVKLLVCPLFNIFDNFRFWLDLTYSKREKRLWARCKGREPAANSSRNLHPQPGGLTGPDFVLVLLLSSLLSVSSQTGPWRLEESLCFRSDNLLSSCEAIRDSWLGAERLLRFERGHAGLSLMPTAAHCKADHLMPNKLLGSRVSTSTLSFSLASGADSGVNLETKWSELPACSRLHLPS